MLYKSGCFSEHASGLQGLDEALLALLRQRTMVLFLKNKIIKKRKQMEI